MDALKLSHVCKEYGDFSLKNVSFALPMGSIMGFIGENGAGKSTTINAILGLIRRDGGEIQVLGRPVDQRPDPELKQQLGVVLDEAGFPQAMTARQVGRMLAGCYKNWDQKGFEEYLKRFSLPDKKPIREFSRGMKMKLELAAALSHGARLLILDEATSGLDPVVRDEIIDLLLEFIQDENHAVLISSHITSDLEKVCDYVTFIHRGEILYSEEKDALLERMCVVKCSAQQLERLDKKAVHGVRRGQFGAEVLAERALVPADLMADPATLEDIIVFTARKER